MTSVKEDFRKRSTVSSRVRSSVAMLPTALLIGLMVASVARDVHAQTGGTQFKASVVDLTASTERVTVALDRSVTIETTIPVDNAASNTLRAIGYRSKSLLQRICDCSDFSGCSSNHR